MLWTKVVCESEVTLSTLLPSPPSAPTSPNFSREGEKMSQTKLQLSSQTCIWLYCFKIRLSKKFPYSLRFVDPCLYLTRCIQKSSHRKGRDHILIPSQRGCLDPLSSFCWHTFTLTRLLCWILAPNHPTSSVMHHS